MRTQKEDPISGIIIRVEMGYFQEICNFLLSHHIGFDMSFNEPLTLSDNQLDAAQMNLEPSPEPPEVTAVHALFDKYTKKEPHLPIPSLKKVAKELELKEQYVATLFRRTYGKSFLQSVLEQRFVYAAQLLREGHRGVEVSKMIGYGPNSGIKFNKMFQKYYGTTPKKYQIKHQK